jgi:hypothetical protein
MFWQFLIRWRHIRIVNGLANITMQELHWICNIISIHNKISSYIKQRFVKCFIVKVKVRVKCTLVQALRLCTGRTAHRGSRGIALPFHNRGTRRGWGVSVTPRPLFTPGKDPVPIVQEAGWAPLPVWTGAENLAPPGFDPRTVQPVASRYTDWATRPIVKVKVTP